MKLNLTGPQLTVIWNQTLYEVIHSLLIHCVDIPFDDKNIDGGFLGTNSTISSSVAVLSINSKRDYLVPHYTDNSLEAAV
jgi:hypothetical protein